MNRQILKLRRDIEQGAPKNCSPYDRYAYNAFSWQAAHWAIHGKTQEERDEATRLRAIAIEKSKAMEVK